MYDHPQKQLLEETACPACLLAILFLLAGDCRWVAPFIPSVKADAKNSSHTHTYGLGCVTGAQAKFRTDLTEQRYFLSPCFFVQCSILDRFVHHFRPILRLNVWLNLQYVFGLCMPGVERFNSCPYMAVIFGFRVTSHPKQQNLMCRSQFSFCFFVAPVLLS